MYELFTLPNYALIFICYLSIAFLLTIFAHFTKRRSPDMVSLIVFVRNTILPTGCILAYLLLEHAIPHHESLLRITETIFGILIVWAAASLTTIVLFTQKKNSGLRDSVPGLVVDITRFALLILGAFVITAFVWNQNFSHLLATLGVGSVVLGFALQETLGNLISGIALFFERPFQLGDWVQVGETIGEVVETNWRSVRVRTRELTLVAVPNSSLTKERIMNFSRPTQVHGVLLHVGFSYEDPPYKVKEVLREVLHQSPKVLSFPPIRIRTKKFDDSSVTYELRFFIDDYSELPEIQEDVMTRIWYAARRHQLSIPFPIRTVFHAPLPSTEKSNTKNTIRLVLDKSQLFTDLGNELKDWLSHQVVEMTFGSGERVITQGDQGDVFYLIAKGKAVIKYQTPQNEEKLVLELDAGDYFGERALYTDEPRSAHVYAVTDLHVFAIYRETFQQLLKRDGEIANRIADLIEYRDKQLLEHSTARGESIANIKQASRTDILSRIRNFLKVT